MIRFFKIFIKLILCFFVLFMGLIIWSVKIEPNLLITKNERIYLPNWHKEHNGFKAAVLTDMHIGSIGINKDKLEKIVSLTNKQKPDVIFLLGDFDSKAIANSKIEQKEIINIFKKFKAPYGVISILGNHDFEPFNISNLLKKSNIIVLENEYLQIKKSNKSFYVVGLKDLWHYRPDVKKTINKANIVKPIILLSHNPDVFPDVPNKVSLTLSGHNHGGQVYLPILGGLFLPSVYGQKYVKGYVVENGKHLYVSSGLGNCGPARFGNLPEIVIIELYKQENSNNVIKNTPPKIGINFSLIDLYLKIVKSESWKKYFVPVYYKFIR